MNTEGKITVSILSFYRDPDFVFYDALETTMFAYRLVKELPSVSKVSLV
jgi:hypothetical protein